MKKVLILAYIICVILGAQAQNVTITPNGINPKSSYPRLSYDAILALPNPQEGDIAYDMSFKCLRVYTDNKWLCSNQTLGDFIPNVSALATAGSTADDFARDITVDGSGNVYIVGTYTSSATFGETAITSLGITDIFIAKYSKIGALLWVRSAGGIYDDQGYSIAVDASQNVYITGYFREAAQFGNTSLTSAGNTDIFIAKYNSDGILQWAQAEGGVNGDQGYEITLDIVGNFYVTGSYFNTATFGSTSITSVGNTDAFITKYNSSGELQWLKSAGSTVADEGTGIATDNNGNVYVIGNFAGTAYFGTTPIVSAGNYDIFFTKLDNNGTFQYVKAVGGEGYEYGEDITVDGIGTVFITGAFSTTAYFDGTARTSVGYYDSFVAKYTIYGILLWVRTAGGPSDDHGNGIAIDSTGNVYVVGFYSQIATFDNISKNASGGYDIFISKYDPNGILQWVITPKGSGIDIGYGIVLNGQGSIYATGYFSSSAVYGNSTKNSAGGKDIFVVRIDN